jgi:hypothetical protein
MANVLSDDKKQQVLALGRLEWSLRKIEGASAVRRRVRICGRRESPFGCHDR